MKLQFAVRAARWKGLARLAAPLFLVSGCSDGPYLMTEEYVTQDGQEERYLGGGCMGVRDSGGISSMSTGMAGAAGAAALQPSYNISYEGGADSVHFTLTNGDGTLLAERNYDVDFLSAGEREEISSPVINGSVRFVHWGSATCEEIREPSGG